MSGHLLVMDRNEVEGSIFTVDVSNKLRHLSLKLRGVRQCGRCHLDHDNVADPLRIIAQQFFESAELQNKTNQISTIIALGD
jgi:hypothetical protein